MDVLVTQQDDTINVIADSAQQVQKDTEAGYVVRSFANIFRLTAVHTASGKPKRLWNMPGQLAESVGSAFSYFSLSWPLLALRSESPSERNRCSIYCLDVGLFYVIQMTTWLDVYDDLGIVFRRCKRVCSTLAQFYLIRLPHSSLY